MEVSYTLEQGKHCERKATFMSILLQLQFTTYENINL